MKKSILIIALTITGFTFEAATAQVNLNINVGAQPAWGPRGYDYVDYYYLPDIDSYYYVPDHQYVYLDRGRWIRRRSLPNRYRNYDLYRGRKVVINSPYPYRHADNYRRKYGSNRGHYREPRMRNNYYPRYAGNRGHYEQKYKKEKDHGNNGNGHGNKGGGGHGNGKGHR